ncbi:MAG: transcription termination/antitermination factor NusG [Erysipelotrichaceae bacterium]|nr:transcription termination/antitermination factor NusG [Erysipelotrichaceae bacterium]MBO4538582.1 transcription termination/antitermination factor NusG [Erysipelotrichaceae bacterium]MBR5049380.1 transcription termination/antitermination factor NusG [Erysipelotrichaceae bacterium]
MDENNNTVETPVTKPEDEKHWYVVNTYAGHERNVKESLETRIANEELQDYIFRIVIAEEEEIDIKNGKQIKKIRNLFPGYLFVEMIMTDKIWYVVRNTPGVTGFIGSSGGGAKPFSVPDEEIDPILRKLGQNDHKIVVNFTVGDRVKILSGAFVNVEGTIQSMDDSSETARVLSIVFGRETPVEVSYVDLEKVD